MQHLSDESFYAIPIAGTDVQRKLEEIAAFCNDRVRGVCLTPSHAPAAANEKGADTKEEKEEETRLSYIEVLHVLKPGDLETMRAQQQEAIAARLAAENKPARPVPVSVGRSPAADDTIERLKRWTSAVSPTAAPKPVSTLAKEWEQRLLLMWEKRIEKAVRSTDLPESATFTFAVPSGLDGPWITRVLIPHVRAKYGLTIVYEGQDYQLRVSLPVPPLPQ